MSAYRAEFVQLTGWDEDVVGLWLAESDDWLLLKQVPGDYVVDCYVLVNKRHIASRKPRRGRRQLEKVLALKGVSTDPPPTLKLEGASTLDLLRWVEQHYEMVEFQDEEDSTFLGWVKEPTATDFRHESLQVNGKVDKDWMMKFPFADLRLITFDDDYFNSLKLLWKANLRTRRRTPKVE